MTKSSSPTLVSACFSLRSFFPLFIFFYVVLVSAFFCIYMFALYAPRSLTPHFVQRLRLVSRSYTYAHPHIHSFSFITHLSPIDLYQGRLFRNCSFFGVLFLLFFFSFSSFLEPACLWLLFFFALNCCSEQTWTLRTRFLYSYPYFLFLAFLTLRNLHCFFFFESSVSLSLSL